MSTIQIVEEDSVRVEYTTIFESSDIILWRIVCDTLTNNQFEFRSLGGELSGNSLGTGEHILSYRIQVPKDDALHVKELLDTISKREVDDEELARLSLSSKRPVQQESKPVALNRGEVELRSFSPLSVGFFFGLGSFFVYIMLLFFQMFTHAPMTKSISWSLIQVVLFGFVSGLVLSNLYNILSRLGGGIRIQTLDLSKLLSQNFTQDACFYRGDSKDVHGPLTRSQLEELYKAGELSPYAVVQMGEHVFMAGQVLGEHTKKSHVEEL